MPEEAPITFDRFVGMRIDELEDGAPSPRWSAVAVARREPRLATVPEPTVEPTQRVLDGGPGEARMMPSLA
jgi:hypothetical protein